MLVVLQSVSGGVPGRRVQLRSGQILKVGSSGWADFSVESDSSLEDVHFEVRCEPEGCIVSGLSPAAPTLINGEPIRTELAYDGDEIKAGATTFTISIEGGPVRPTAEEPDPAPAAAADTVRGAAVAAAAAPVGVVGVCAYLEFGDDVNELAEKTATADELIAELTAQEKFQDALRLRAFTLEKRKAVWWGCYCLQNLLDDELAVEQAQAVEAAAEWVRDPSESNRRAAEKAAASANYSGPGASQALSAYWSNGSLAPEGSPDVEPDERLTSQGVAAALVAAAYLGDPREAPVRFNRFLECGKGVAEGTIPLPDGAASS